MRPMKFDKPVFHKGLNCTVRLGEKWKWRLNIGEEFLVESIDKFWIMVTRKLLVARLKDLKKSDIKKEHEKKCRTLEGLRKELKRIYGKDKITDNIVVTVVYFEVVNW